MDNISKDSKIHVAGHMGLVGSAIVRALKKRGYNNLVARTHQELDLTDSVATADFFKKEKPGYVFLAAAKVGGIKANHEQPADFMMENMRIEDNVIHSSYLNGVKKLLFLGSNCIYPKHCDQPMKEEYLLKGDIEPTNEPYAIAKIAGIKMCQSYNRQYGTNFISAIPASIFGPNDHFDDNAHVLGSMIKKFHLAKLNGGSVTLWGTGKPLREFMYADDAADAILFLMDNFNPTKEQNDKGEVYINTGTGVEYSIRDLAGVVQEAVGYKGQVTWDDTKPDGMPRKLLDNSRFYSMGWKPKTSFADGLKEAYKWYTDNY